MSKTTYDFLIEKYAPLQPEPIDQELEDWKEGRRKLDELIEKRKKEQQTLVEKSAGHPTSKLLEFK